MRRANLIAGGLLIFLSTFIICLAAQLPQKITGAGLGPGIIPAYLAVLLGCLALVLILSNIRVASDEQELQISKQEMKGLIVIFLAQATYLFSIKYLGFGLATFLFVSFLTNLLGRYAWWKCAILGLIFAVLTVQIFNNMLGLQLPGFRGF